MNLRRNTVPYRIKMCETNSPPSTLRRHILVLTAVCVLFVSSASVSAQLKNSPRFTKALCHRDMGFIKPQQQICRKSYQLMPSVLRGHGMALEECQHQFRHQRWNCTGHNVTLEERGRKRNKVRTYMDRLLAKGTREAGFLLAMTSAGVSYAVTKACSSGDYSLCGCDRTIYDYPKDSKTKFKWSGCSDNIHYGVAFSAGFLDAKANRRMSKKNKIGLGLINLHNNNAGRKTVEDMMKIDCKCHGVSGSCELQTCWRALPRFRFVGDFLQQRFHKAIMVQYTKPRLVPVDSRVTQGHNDLLYLEQSADYCNHNPSWGSLGTRGRLCNDTDPTQPNSCQMLCCSRGHSTHSFRQEVDCHCKFVWCCSVKCLKCNVQVVVATCK